MERPFASWPLFIIFSGIAVLASAKRHTHWDEKTETPHWRTVTTFPPSTATPALAFATASPLPEACPSLPSSAIKLSTPSSAPPDAVQVPADFVGFGFETAFLSNYAVGTFSENLINSVAKRLSVSITIRIGGTTGDRIRRLAPNQQEDKICVEGDCPVGSDATYTLGPSHFEAFKRFQNQRMTFQVPMGPDVNINQSVEYAKRAYNALGADRVAGIALGNEVDIYNSQHDDPYTISDYTRDATALQTALTSALHLPPSRIFEVLNLASPEGADSFTVPSAWQSGIDALSRIQSAATHWYQFPTFSTTTYTPQTMQRYLLNHTAITTRFAAAYTQGLAYITTHAPEISYILSETGSSLIGPPLELQDSFGAAVWAVDFHLYVMSRGVKRVHASQRPAAHHSLWVPDASTSDPGLGEEMNVGPQVRGPWFAAPFVADFVGESPGGVVRLWEGEFGVAYGMFDSASGELGKVALLNLRFWAKDTGAVDGGAERGNVTFSIPVQDRSVKKVTVRRLRADAGAHALGLDAGGDDQLITWAGETWSYAVDNGRGHFVDGVARSENFEVCDGMAVVSVEDTGAAIVFLDS